MQQILAITNLTWKAALRYRLFLVIAVLLVVAVVGLPMLIKDDGTARGFTQIVLTYTLGAVTALLGLCTLWLSCGTLARDIEECQMQVVATKPIARWQIWLGKWLGIVTLNAALLAISGACVFGLMQWRSRTLPPKEQEVLRTEVLVARGSAKPPDVQDDIQSDARKILEERLKKTPLSSPDDVKEVQNQILEQVKAEYQLVPPGYSKTWEIHFGEKAKTLRNQPLQVRMKFNTADRTTSGTYGGLWQAGVPQKTKLWRSEPMSLAPDTFHEFQIPAGLIDDNGVLTISFGNFNSTALLFPLDDGMEVLYRDGGFGLNFVRGLAIILCWMALLAAIGLASASFLSFAVAALLSLTILIMTLASGTMASVVSEGTIDSNNSAQGSVVIWALNHVIVPAFSVAVKIINFATNSSPIDALSTGRSISWADLGLAFAQVVLVLGGIFALGGIFLFTRRELATAQAQ
jgi:ABC-type transport system involved in multi-copper enzyme maturation permease subunit